MLRLYYELHTRHTVHYVALPAGGVIVQITATEWLDSGITSDILSAPNPNTNLNLIDTLEDVDVLLTSQRMHMPKTALQT